MTEMELRLSGGRIVSAEVKDGVLKILVEEEKEVLKETPKALEKEVVQAENESLDQFVLIPASSLSLADDFMQYTPKTDKEVNFKKDLIEAIEAGVSDFYRPKIDPSVDHKGDICYQAGLKPIVRKSYYWWREQAQTFCPERKSRLETKHEYVAFLGVLLKKLVESGWEVATAWHAVCNNSRSLGHYWNSDNALKNLAPTGYMEICGFYDLGNTEKILAEDEEAGCFWRAGGCYGSYSHCRPLAYFLHCYCLDSVNYDSVGVIVLPA